MGFFLTKIYAYFEYLTYYHQRHIVYFEEVHPVP